MLKPLEYWKLWGTNRISALLEVETNSTGDRSRPSAAAIRVRRALGNGNQEGCGGKIGKTAALKGAVAMMLP
ncbi:MAG: hypothetical protein WDO18_03940 [Acidobacteriota bacterium]